MAATNVLARARRTPLASIAARFARYPSTLIGFAIVFAFLLMAVIGPLVAPYGYSDQSISDRLQPPSAQHWFGTDQFGRDIFSRILVGSRDVCWWQARAPCWRSCWA